MAGKTCVLAVDLSGSVRGCTLYWNKIAELLNKVTSDKNYLNYVYIVWNLEFENVSLEALQSHIQENFGTSGTNPAVVWDCLQELRLTNYDLHLTTDGEIWHTEYQSYCEKYFNLQTKPEKITMYYIGRLSEMNMQFLDCFEVVDYEIHGVDAMSKLVEYTSKKIGKNYLLNQLCDIDEFQQIKSQAIAADDETAITNALENLYKTLYRKMAEYSETEMNEGGVGIEFKKFVDLVNKYVHCNYINVGTEDEVAAFDELFDDYHSNSTKIFGIFVKQFEAATLIDYRKVLSRIMELGNGQSKVDRRLEAYGDSWHTRAANAMDASDEILNDDSSDAEETRDDGDDAAAAAMDANESSASCPILMLDSTEYNKFCVAWIGSDDSFGGDGHKNFFDLEIRRKLAKNTMRLYQYLSAEKLNQRIPPANQHISIDAFIGLQQLTDLNAIGAERFKRIYKSPVHQAKCFGIVLYNADTKYHWPDGKLTEHEKNIYLHNYATISQLLFGDSKFVGSFPLLQTFFLNILYTCSGCDSYLKACITETLKRSSQILKCYLMIESGIEPKIHSTIKNAIIFHTQIYPNEIERLNRHVAGIHALNIPRKCIQYCLEFLNLAKHLFGVAYTADYKRKLVLWRFWNYMLCIENMSHDHKMLHFKQIALSRNQKWMRIDGGDDDDSNSHVKIVFIEGRSDGACFEYLNDVDYDDLAKLVVLFEDKTATDQWYNIQIIDEIPELSCNMEDDVAFCKARCGYPIICPYTKLPQLQCYEQQKFNLLDYGHPKTSSILFAHSYVQKCKQLILMKSKNEKGMQLPNVAELKKFIVKMAPLAVYHKDIDEILKKLIEKHQTWYNWYANCDENEKKKYLCIGLDWEKILHYQNTNENIQKQLENCDCPAHQLSN